MTSLRTPLHDRHLALKARMLPFAGWDMPIQYAGIMDEHRAVRSHCGLFDVSHMGRLRIAGPGAAGFLARQVTRRVDDLRPGQVRYALACADDGTVEDDVLVAREGSEAFHIVVNASNRERICALWQPCDGDACSLTDLTAEEAMIAVQGPAALDLLAGLGVDGRDLRYYRFADLAFQGHHLRFSRTGYTGEDGAELMGPPATIVAIWDALIAAGASPCGLGARDTLRLEAGMPLYGHELDRAHTPIEAGLAFAVNSGGGFRGDAVLLRQLTEGCAVSLAGLTLHSRRIARQGYRVLDAAGADVGVITSGTFSPTLERSIAMAWLPTALAKPGTPVQVDLRGSPEAATVCALPFYRRAGR